METEHTPPTAEAIAARALAGSKPTCCESELTDERDEDGRPICRWRGLPNVCHCRIDTAAPVAALRSEGLLRPDTPSAASDSAFVDAVRLACSLLFASGYGERPSVGESGSNEERAYFALRDALGGLAVGSEPSTDEMIAELLPEGTDAEVEMHAYRDEDGLHVTVGYETDQYRETSDYTLTAALSAALAASAPKGE